MNEPVLSREDVGAFVQILTAFVMMGTTRVEVHPARWPLIFAGLITHGAFDRSQVVYLEGEPSIATAILEIQLAVGEGKSLNAILCQRSEHAGETDTQASRIDGQGEHYQVPEEPDLVTLVDRSLLLS